MILYVLRYWPTATETFVHDEIRGLRARGVPIELAAFDPREDPGNGPPCPVHAQPHGRGWWGHPTLLAEAARGPASRRVLWLAALLRRLRPTRVHVHFAGEAAAWTREACRRVGVPWSVTVHATDLWRPHPALPDLLRDACAVATVARYNQPAIEAMGVRPQLLRCGVEIGRPEDTAVPRTRLVSVGRDVPKKGLDVLARAAARLPGEPVLLYSDRASSPGVTSVGLRPHAEVLASVRSALAFVLPCRVAPDGDRDGVPVAMLEALAAGVPVVTTPVAGIPEVVDDEVGWVVPPEDDAALEAALRAVLADPTEAARRGARGPARLRARGFAREDTLAAVEAFLRGGSGRSALR